jgi:hypothetical protein
MNLIEEFMKAHNPDTDSRTKKNVKTYLLGALAVNPFISGPESGQLGQSEKVYQTTLAEMNNPKFSYALDVIVETMLELFPVCGCDEEAQNLTSV